MLKIVVIAGLHSQSPSHFARQPSVRVSPNLRSSYLSHKIAAATYADKYKHVHRPDLKTHTHTHTPIYAHSPDSRFQPRLTNVSSGWSWKLRGINHAMQVSLWNQVNEVHTLLCPLQEPHKQNHGYTYGHVYYNIFLIIYKLKNIWHLVKLHRNYFKA